MAVTERSSPNLVTYTTAVQLRIKEIITKDILAGVDRQTTFRKLKQLIERFGAQIKDANVRKQFETSLARGSVKIYSEFTARLQETAETLSVSVMAVISLMTAKRTQQETEPNAIDVPVTSDSDGGDSKVREILYENRIDVPDIRKRLKAELRRMIEAIADEDIKDRNGASLRNIAEIHVRRDYQQASIAEMKANGVILVWASTHVDCSPRCFPFQGRLYSLNGTYGTTATGIPYEPLENATNIPYTTKAGITYMNGLLGFNCRHRMIPYNDEQEPPKGYTQAQAVKAYQLDLEQRAIERQIRRVKEQAHLLRGVDNSVSRALFADAKKMTEGYRKFCRENDRVAMIYRTQVTVEEQEFNKKLKASS